MENFEVPLHVNGDAVGEKATNIKLSIDLNNREIILSGNKVVITASGKEITEQLPFGIFNANGSEFERMIADQTVKLTENETEQFNEIIVLTDELTENIRVLVSEYMQKIYELRY